MFRKDRASYAATSSEVQALDTLEQPGHPFADFAALPAKTFDFDSQLLVDRPG